MRAVDSESASRFVGRAIEEIEVGQRVLAHNPDSRFEGDVLEPEPSPDSWRVVRIVMQKHDGGRLEITLLRSLEWLEERGATVGSVIELDTSELNACGQALVTAIEPCPEIEGGEGRVVIGTFRHDSSRIVDLRIEGLDEPIGTTSDHPFWSRDRAGFVEASQLRSGESLLSIEGESLTVESVSERVGQSVVHNLEIQGLHTYTVSTLGVVVHNNCVTGGASSKIWSKIDTPWGRSVLRRSDVDWDYIRPDGLGTNAQAARRGYAPIRPNAQGKHDVLVLHHMNNDPGGSLVEVWSSTHNARHVADRLNGKWLASGDPRGVPDSLLNWRDKNPQWARDWNTEQSVYWKWVQGVYTPPAGGVRVPPTQIGQ